MPESVGNLIAIFLGLTALWFLAASWYGSVDSSCHGRNQVWKVIGLP